MSIITKVSISFYRHFKGISIFPQMIQLILIICEFAYLLRFICNPQINSHSTFVVISGHAECKKIELPHVQVPSWCQTRQCSAFLFQLLHCKKVSFSWSILCTFFTFLCFLLVNLVFKKVPKYSAEALFSVPECRNAVLCLREKIHVSEKLLSGKSYGAKDMSSKSLNQQYIK